LKPLFEAEERIAAYGAKATAEVFSLLRQSAYILWSFTVKL